MIAHINRLRVSVREFKYPFEKLARAKWKGWLSWKKRDTERRERIRRERKNDSDQGKQLTSKEDLVLEKDTESKKKEEKGEYLVGSFHIELELDRRMSVGG